MYLFICVCIYVYIYYIYKSETRACPYLEHVEVWLGLQMEALAQGDVLCE